MYFQVFLGLICAGLISLTVTPIVRVLAYKIGAVDVPKDNRRMHKKPMPLLGGLSIFLGFSISSLIFCDITLAMIAAWFGGLLIITIGILDDKYALNAWIKLLGQIAAAMIAAVTFVICLVGLFIGKKMGTKLAGKAGILGGVILILIGLEIFITSFF